MSTFIPDLFVIGAMKAGTSTLFRNILDHPAICRTASKEVNLFLKDYSLQQLNTLYTRQFQNPSLLKCDTSPRYSQHHNYPGVARRIYEANSQAKIMYITRDPIHRIVSHLQHNQLRDRYEESQLENEVMQNPDYLLCSKYDDQISEYLNVFPQGQILVLVLEELNTNPRLFCNRLGSFLGIPFPEYQDRKFNVSEGRYKIKYYDWVHNHIHIQPILKLYHFFWLMINIRPDKPVLSDDIKSLLRHELESDVKRFVTRFNLDINLWPNFA